MDLTQELLKAISEKYQASIEHLWRDHPSYTVVRDSVSRKWFALFMRIRLANLGITGAEADTEVPVANFKADPEGIPCYRIVNSQGRLSGRFAFGGEDVQKERLQADGIEVSEDYKVDLNKYGF